MNKPGGFPIPTEFTACKLLVYVHLMLRAAIFEIRIHLSDEEAESI